jgi:antitoxin ParD1/3/4
MPMVKKSISVTDQQDGWIKAQIETGHYGNESEVVRDLIRDRQMREWETPEEIAAIRAALIEGEKSGISARSVDEIWEEARQRHRSKHA